MDECQTPINTSLKSTAALAYLTTHCQIGSVNPVGNENGTVAFAPGQNLNAPFPGTMI